MKILIVDDDPLYSVSGLQAELLREGMGHHEIVQERHPDLVEKNLDEHPDVKLVFIDMHFHQAGTLLTGLTALQCLAWRAHPAAAIYCQPEPNRRLFPYAACQLFDRPPVAWIQKTFEAVHEQALPLIRQISDGRIPSRSATLDACYATNPATGKLMRQLLGNNGDLKIWRAVSRARQTHEEIAALIHYSKSTVRKRFDSYVNAIIAFAAANNDPDTPGTDDPARTVWKFAEQNSEFFRAPELEELIFKKFGAKNC